MKTYFLILTLFVCTYNTQAQISKYHEDKDKELQATDFWVHLPLGLNCPSGYIGIGGEQRLSVKNTIYGGVGLSTWGTKFALGTRFYRNYPIKGVLGIGLSYATGYTERDLSINASNPNNVVVDTTVSMTTNPAVQLNITWGYSWKMGKKSRFYFETGWSIRTSTKPKYSIKTIGYTASDVTKIVMNVFEPSGLILTIGFAFGM
jgi:hypothetical protein